jgi:glycerol transport system permease protein
MLVKKLTYHPIPYTWILILIIRMFIVMVGFTRRKFSHDQQDDQSKSLVHGLASLALVAFNAIIPLMTVVNYSVQETFGNNLFFGRESGGLRK